MPGVQIDVTANTGEAVRDIRELDAVLNEMDRARTTSGSGGGNVVRDLQNQKSALTDTLAAVRNLAAAYAAFKSFEFFKQQTVELMRVAADFEKLEYSLNRFALTSAMAKQQAAWLADLGQETVGVRNLTRAFIELEAVGIRPSRAALEGLIGYQRSVGKTAPQDFNAMISKMAQLYQLGSVGMDDSLKELSQHIPFVMSALKEKLGMGIGQLMMEFKKRSIDFATVIEASMEYSAKHYRSSIEETANQWDVMVQRMENRTEMFRKRVMDSGGFRVLSDWLRRTLDEIDQMQKTGELDQYAEAVGKNFAEFFKILSGGDFSARSVLETIRGLSEAMKNFAPILRDAGSGLSTVMGLLDQLLQVYNKLPDDVRGAAGYGLLGKILFGNQVGGYMFLASLLTNLFISANNAAKNSGLPSIPATGRGMEGLLSDTVGNAGAAADWVLNIDKHIRNRMNNPNFLAYGPGAAPAGPAYQIPDPHPITPEMLKQGQGVVAEVAKDAEAATENLSRVNQAIEQLKGQTDFKEGQVVKVVDADTFVVFQNGQFVRVRLQNVDAPESYQPFGKESTAWTKNAILGKQVQLQNIVGKDQEGRVVADVLFDNGVDLGTELVKAGMAWVYQKNGGLDDKTWVDRMTAETAARSKKTGLFADPDAMQPWKYRKEWSHLNPVNEMTPGEMSQYQAGELQFYNRRREVENSIKAEYEALLKAGDTAGKTQDELYRTERDLQLQKVVEGVQKDRAILEQYKQQLIASGHDAGELEVLFKENDEKMKKAVAARDKAVAANEALWEERRDEKWETVKIGYTRFTESIRDTNELLRNITQSAESEGLTWQHRILDAEKTKIDREMDNFIKSIAERANRVLIAKAEFEKQLRQSGRADTDEGQAALAKANEDYEKLAAILKAFAPRVEEIKQAKYGHAEDKINAQQALSIAQLNVQYVQLTGNVKDQLTAQIAANEAQMRSNDVSEKSREEIARMNAVLKEQNRLLELRRSGTFTQGFQEGMRQVWQQMPTEADRGIEAAKRMKQGFDDLADSIATTAETGKVNFSSLTTSIIHDLDRMLIQTLITDRIFKAVMSWLMPGSSYPGAGTYGVNPGSVNWHAAGDYWFNEPTFAVGMKSGRSHMIAEYEPEYLAGGRSKVDEMTGRSGDFNTTIQVSVDARGSDAAGGGDPKAAERLGSHVARAVEAKVEAVIQKHLRPGGMLNRGIG